LVALSMPPGTAAEKANGEQIDKLIQQLGSSLGAATSTTVPAG